MTHRVFCILVIFTCIFCTFVRTEIKDHVRELNDFMEKYEHILSPKKRQGYGPRPPCGGRRQRKEVRQMSKAEWNRFTRAINALKRKGKYDEIASIHRGPRIRSAHGGPNFLGWHRIYLYVLEELLREEEPCVTIPYWDSTLDYDMTNPAFSVLWTPEFFGNGDYEVTSGPFANWITGTNDNLTRNIGSMSGSLISKEGVAKVLSRTNHSQITDFSDFEHNLEGYHNGPHVWVDGQMTLSNEAAEDPVFFLHHAFIDCIWYWFQAKIYRNHRIDSFNDYPFIDGPHSANNEMDPFAVYESFSGITNRDGYHRKFFWGLYTCKSMPTCFPSCGSKHLTCDRKRNRCVSKESMLPSRMQEPREPPSIRQGEKFISPFIDPRASSMPLPQRLPNSRAFEENENQIQHNLNLNFIEQIVQNGRPICKSCRQQASRTRTHTVRTHHTRTQFNRMRITHSRTSS